MVVIAVRNNKPEAVLDYDQFCEMVERDYQLDKQDLASLIEDAILHYTQHPELNSCLDEVVERLDEDEIKSHDGIYGDDYYRAVEEIQEAQEEIRNEIEALQSNSRKGNTKADIARRLDVIVSNMNHIL